MLLLRFLYHVHKFTLPFPFMGGSWLGATCVIIGTMELHRCVVDAYYDHNRCVICKKVISSVIIIVCTITFFAHYCRYANLFKKKMELVDISSRVKHHIFTS